MKASFTIKVDGVSLYNLSHSIDQVARYADAYGLGLDEIIVSADELGLHIEVDNEGSLS